MGDPALYRSSIPEAEQSAPDESVSAPSALELPLSQLIAEDFVTYDKNLLEPGFWAVLVHRFGSRLPQKGPARPPLDLAYKVASTAIDWVWGIKLPRKLSLGRRVRIWHNGAILLNARSIGNDVHIRHDTTFGALRSEDASDPRSLPVIEDEADIGSGACVLGSVTVGRGAIVGANSVVLKPVPPHTAVLGVPARIIPG